MKLPQNKPVINVTAAAQAAAAMAAISFFPSEPAARTMIADAIMDICVTVEDAMWLARRVVQLHKRWDTCGIMGLWQIWFSKHPPRTPKEAKLETLVGASEAYPEGVPSEELREFDELPPGGGMRSLPAGVRALLRESEVQSADPELDQTVTDLAERLSATAEADLAAGLKVTAPQGHYIRTPAEKRLDATLRRMYNEPVKDNE